MPNVATPAARKTIAIAAPRCQASHERQMLSARAIRGRSWYGTSSTVRRMKASDEADARPDLAEKRAALPGLDAVWDAAGSHDLYLVGGAVRDLMAGHDAADLDLDIAVVAPPEDVLALALRIDPEARVHDRFGTATVRIGGTRVDLAATRAEEYGRPGALPAVRTAPIADDLARRDFTVNAMALPIAGD